MSLLPLLLVVTVYVYLRSARWVESEEDRSRLWRPQRLTLNIGCLGGFLIVLLLSAASVGLSTAKDGRLLQFIGLFLVFLTMAFAGAAVTLELMRRDITGCRALDSALVALPLALALSGAVLGLPRLPRGILSPKGLLAAAMFGFALSAALKTMDREGRS